MKKLNFVSVICIIFSLFAFTTAWSLDFSNSNKELPPVNGSIGDATSDNQSDPLLGDRGLAMPVDICSTLKGLSATKFADSDLIDVAKTEIETYCRENNIAVEKVISVIESFDTEFQVNAHGGQSRSLAPPPTDPSQPTIMISSYSDAEDFARLMTQITGELVQEDKRREAIDIENEKKGIETKTSKIFDGNEIMSPNMVMSTYTLPIGRIAYKYPEVKGTNLLLGALDFLLNADLEKMGGVDGYNILDLDTGLLMALSKHADWKSDWKDVVSIRAGRVGYQAAIKGLNALYPENNDTPPITIRDAAEMENFAELIAVATTAYNNSRNGFHLSSFELFWREVIRGVQRQHQGEMQYSTITNYIKENYELD